MFKNIFSPVLLNYRARIAYLFIYTTVVPLSYHYHTTVIPLSVQIRNKFESNLYRI